MSIFKAKFSDNYDRGCDELAKLKIFNKEKKSSAPAFSQLPGRLMQIKRRLLSSGRP